MVIRQNAFLLLFIICLLDGVLAGFAPPPDIIVRYIIVGLNDDGQLKDVARKRYSMEVNQQVHDQGRAGGDVRSISREPGPLLASLMIPNINNGPLISDNNNNNGDSNKNSLKTNVLTGQVAGNSIVVSFVSMMAGGSTPAPVTYGSSTGEPARPSLQ